MAFEKLIESWEIQKRDRLRYSQKIRQRLFEKGPPIYLKYGIQRAVLFGSFARRDGVYGSDIDLFVDPLPPESYWQFRHELEEALGFPIDLYTRGDDTRFVAKILSRGEVIYDTQDRAP